MTRYLWIGLGGCLGAIARYLLVGWAAQRWGTTFPYGTLLVNVSGSFLLCFLAEVLSTRLALYPTLRLALTVGFLGAYTTFSTFSYEWLQLAQDGNGWQSLGYLLGSVLGGGLAGLLGLLLGRGL
ncbi:MAG: putative fluoride ion transporter CrcB [Candidatus Tectimicrobiota bacterium]|nr:MAG: putative fluoride ion transporter CrcB [Candidatus Tectomicrobia bacterium]